MKALELMGLACMLFSKRNQKTGLKPRKIMFIQKSFQRFGMLRARSSVGAGSSGVELCFEHVTL